MLGLKGIYDCLRLFGGTRNNIGVQEVKAEVKNLGLICWPKTPTLMIIFNLENIIDTKHLFLCR